jgi:hypothetical protein
LCKPYRGKLFIFFLSCWPSHSRKESQLKHIGMGHVSVVCVRCNATDFQVSSCQWSKACKTFFCWATSARNPDAL